VATFRLRNDAAQTNELYVLRADGSIVGERENIQPGDEAELTVELDSGAHQLLCKPGMTGDGIATAITVTGDNESAVDPRIDAAVAGYRTYAEAQAQSSLELTKQLAAAFGTVRRLTVSPSKLQNRGTVHAIGGEIIERLVGGRKVVARDPHLQPHAVSDGEQLFPVGAGVRGDTDQLLLVEELLLVPQPRDIGQVDPSNGKAPATVESTQRDRNESADRREQDRRVERLWRPILDARRR
jgi:hypothetical protein